MDGNYLNKYFTFTCFILAFTFFTCSSLRDLPARLLVVNGDNREVVTRGESWRKVNGAIEGTGWYNQLYINRKVEDSDFILSARMSLAKIDTSTALVNLFDNHFGFDSKGESEENRGRFFFFSPDKKIFRHFGKASEVIDPGKPFNLEIERKGKFFTFKINEGEVAKIPLSEFSSPLEGEIGFRPWTNTMRIYDLSIRGNTEVFPRLDYVFEKGEAGYVCFRIPAIIEVPSGDLLAFAEGRKDNCFSDAGDIDLVMKRSRDGGLSWGPLQIVWDDGANTCAAPVPIWEERTQRLLLLACHSLGIDTFDDIMSGKALGRRRVFKLESWDEGKNWSSAREITAQVKKEEWLWYGTGPGSAIQLTRGPHRGRLVVACHHIRESDKKYHAHLIYSDDSGSSWTIGGVAEKAGGNESEVVQLEDASLYINMRNYDKGGSCRQVARSFDGGESLTEQRLDTTLIEPVCQGSLLSIQSIPMLLFANPHSTEDRIDLSIRGSYNGGNTWPRVRNVFPGPSAYSDLVDLGDRQIGCLYERGTIWPYQGISFEVLDLSDWKKR